jgi:hypothetical protein
MKKITVVPRGSNNSKKKKNLHSIYLINPCKKPETRTIIKKN